MTKDDLNVMFSKNTDNWKTPKNIYDQFIKGRLHFNDEKRCAPFPSIIMYLSYFKERFVTCSIREARL